MSFFLFSFLFLASVRPAGNSSAPNGTLIHPEEVDSGIVAIISIVIGIALIVLIGIVSVFCRNFVYNLFVILEFFTHNSTGYFMYIQTLCAQKPNLNEFR